MTMPEIILATDIIARLINNEVKTKEGRFPGRSKRSSLKNGTMIISCVVVMKINPLSHLDRNIRPRSTGADTNNEKASNSFSYANERCTPITTMNKFIYENFPADYLDNFSDDIFVEIANN